MVEEIQRLIDQGLSDRKIARALRIRRTRVAEIRSMGPKALAPFVSQVMSPPLGREPAWASTIEWSAVLDEIGRGFELKRIWEERAGSLTSYPNFWKYLVRRHPTILRQTVSIREFSPGSQCEVDWAGGTIPWWDSSGRQHEAHVFLGTLCHSQLIFAYAFENEKKEAWQSAHVKMYSFFGGAPAVTAPDNLKAGVVRTHLYDPDLNPGYWQLAVHYRTAVVPARVKRPKDKSLVELSVKLVMRLFLWMHRHRRFRSLSEVNEALRQTCERINHKPHSRFKISRRARFEKNERAHLRALPEIPFELIEWKTARVHPDSTISVDSATYSVPHIHRGKEVRVKLTRNQVEVFLGLSRIALHTRDRNRSGMRVIEPAHLPPNAKAYWETTPQSLLSQARFVNSSLHSLFESLFQEDALGHLRRAQGLLRRARVEIEQLGKLDADPRITLAIDQMKRFGKIRVSYFDSQLTLLRKQALKPKEDRNIHRIPGNPMLRHKAMAQEQMGFNIAPSPQKENQL
jgi:hypothetical protein